MEIEKEEVASDKNLALKDSIAELTGADNTRFAEVQATYENDARTFFLRARLKTFEGGKLLLF